MSWQDDVMIEQYIADILDEMSETEWKELYGKNSRT